MARKKLAYPGTETNAPFVRPHIDCAHDGCRNPAMVRQRTKIGFANFCIPHYDQYWIEVARGTIEEWKPTEPSYRERWYAERGLPYEPPPSSPQFRAGTLQGGRIPQK